MENINLHKGRKGKEAKEDGYQVTDKYAMLQTHRLEISIRSTNKATWKMETEGNKYTCTWKTNSHH